MAMTSVQLPATATSDMRLRAATATAPPPTTDRDVGEIARLEAERTDVLASKVRLPGKTWAAWTGGLTGAAMGIGAYFGAAALLMRNPSNEASNAMLVFGIALLATPLGAWGGARLGRRLTQVTGPEANRLRSAHQADVDRKVAEIDGEIAAVRGPAAH